MAMKKLASNIQSLFCASAKIFSYKSAVEELVYNSLDAEATSIAIRVNIAENIIQVIDNGTGIVKNDFKLLGQRYATSKYVDFSTLKSAPNKYGFRGQSLASIIEVSKRLTITSRCANTDETFTKEFYKGKEHRLDEATMRPSKGTTVEIKGFLHNLHIQKKSVDSLSELSDIKIFLKQLSLVHHNISVSLRDDSKNEIVFKLHKNRDIYQTLSTVFEVDKRDVQELKVEKNEYKVTAIIANRDKDISQYHWVYLNGKFMNSSKTYKVIDEYLIKLLNLKNTKRKTKSKNNLAEKEDITSNKSIPMYFIFITCPYYDYDISFKSKASTLEFKDWERLKKIIEKLVKFYVGDVRLKEIAASKPLERKGNEKEDETREQVKRIMERILRSNCRKPRVSQMQNGVKGKIIKRKSKKKITKLPITKLILPENSVGNNAPDFITNDNNVISLEAGEHDKNIQSVRNASMVIEKNYKPLKKVKQHNNDSTKNLERKKINEKNSALQNICEDNIQRKLNSQKKKKKTTHANKSKWNELKNKTKQKIIKTRTKLQNKENELKDNKKKPVEDTILNKFKKDSDSVKVRCNGLSRNVEKLMSYKKKRKSKIFVNETVHYSTVIKDNKNVSVRKKIDEIIIQDYIPLPPRNYPCSIDNRVWKKLPKKSFRTSYDLIQTILKSQQECFANTNQINVISSQLNNYSKQIEISDNQKDKSDDIQHCKVSNSECYETLSEVHKFTYDSHHYRRRNTHHYNSNNRRDLNISNENDDLNFNEIRNGNKHFITKQSRDNFILPGLRQFRSRIENGDKKYFLSTRQPHKWKKSTFANLDNNFNNNSWQQDNSITIDYTQTNDFECNKNNNLKNLHVNSDNPPYQEYGKIQSNSVCGGTYTIISNTSHTSRSDGGCQYQQSNRISLTQRTYCIRTSNERRIKSNGGNVDFIVDGEGNEELLVRDNEPDRNNCNIIFQNNILNQSEVQPIDICETTMKSYENVKDDSIRKINFNDSLFNYDFSIDSVLFDRDAYSRKDYAEDEQAKICKENYSQYFEGKENNLQEAENTLRETDDVHKINHKKIMKANEHFNLKTRPRFIPKGLSPILANCQTTKACEYNLENDYYENTIYDQFVNEVQVQSEIFEANIQHVKELKSKDITRVNDRLDKDNASLVFNGESLAQAIVLRQVDCKFIAVKIRGRCSQSADISEYLVFFDQHAVHERIRLEKNLAEYLIQDEWKSIGLEEMPLKLSKEEVIYLHNYSDKFTQFGLQWSLLSNEEVKITAIPEAILGKNPRQVDVVMKAVKNLISEQVQAIKTQKGCVSLYPKSIMDLVFSEACRYAIKFGDRLSTPECEELLKSLSKCKTPFQCAHGRPVMAVLLGIETDPNRRQYKIVTSKLHQFITSVK